MCHRIEKIIAQMKIPKLFIIYDNDLVMFDEEAAREKFMKK